MSKKIKEPVRLREKKLANGNRSLYLDCYWDGNRSYEFLKLYLIPESTRADRERNRRTLATAQAIQAQRILDIQSRIENGEPMTVQSRGAQVLLYDYAEHLAEMQGAARTRNRYMTVVKMMREYDDSEPTIGEITLQWGQGFKQFLEAVPVNMTRKAAYRSNKLLAHNTKSNYIGVLKTIFNRAVRDGLIEVSPLANLESIPLREGQRVYLTIEEVRAMAATPCENEELKRMFLFACLTGMRVSDIEAMTWRQVEQTDGRWRVAFRQRKTGGAEWLDLTAQAAELMGERGEDDAHIFNRGIGQQCAGPKLQEWALRAGVKKR